MLRRRSQAALAVIITLTFGAVSAPAATAAPCAKQSRAVTSAKKAVTKAQKAKAPSPAARKQRAKRVKAAKAKHSRAKRTLATCKGKAKPTPAPAAPPTPAPAAPPAPTPAPAPPPPLFTIPAAIAPREGLAVTMAAPVPPAGFHYRLQFSATRPPGTIEQQLAANCEWGVTRDWINATGITLLYATYPWCPGPATLSLLRVPDGSPMSYAGEVLLATPVTVNPA